eukprot:3885651-Prymnesium_polylepis.1
MCGAGEVGVVNQEGGAGSMRRGPPARGLRRTGSCAGKNWALSSSRQGWPPEPEPPSPCREGRRQRRAC